MHRATTKINTVSLHAALQIWLHHCIHCNCLTYHPVSWIPARRLGGEIVRPGRTKSQRCLCFHATATTLSRAAPNWRVHVRTPPTYAYHIPDYSWVHLIRKRVL